MARARRRTATPEIDSDSDNTDSVDTTPERAKGGVTNMAGLTAEQIQALLGKTRTKGQYLEYLNEFVASGEQGVNVNETWVALRDKKATTLKQGFENAKEKKEAAEGSENVKVIANEDMVYLINLTAAGLEVPETEAVA